MKGRAYDEGRVGDADDGRAGGGEGRRGVERESDRGGL